MGCDCTSDLRRNSTRKLQNTGITLIALIITIIILLILAGVTINFVLGENGILNKATKVVGINQKATAKEQIAIAWATCQTNYLKKGDEQPKESFFTKETLTSNLSQGEVTAVSVEVDDLGNSELVYKIGDLYYKIQVSSDGEVNIIGEAESTPPAIKDSITLSKRGSLLNKVKENPAAYYGKKVSGYIANGISDWRIFYTDENNVFLIATDYITSQKAIASNETMIAYGDYDVYWSSVPTVADTTNVAKFSPIIAETVKDSTDYKLLSSGKCASTLLDTNKWAAFLDKADGTGKGKMAIGSPTLNMWVASWNTKYPDNKIYCNNSNVTRI